METPGQGTHPRHRPLISREGIGRSVSLLCIWVSAGSSKGAEIVCRPPLVVTGVYNRSGWVPMGGWTWLPVLEEDPVAGEA